MDKPKTSVTDWLFIASVAPALLIPPVSKAVVLAVQRVCEAVRGS